MNLTQEEIKIIKATLSLNEAKFQREKSEFEKLIRRHNSLSNIKIKSFKLRKLINKILEKVRREHHLQIEAIMLDKVYYRNSLGIDTIS